LRNAQRCQDNINGAKNAVLFHQHVCRDFTACFRLKPLCRASYFGSFLTNAVAIEIIKNNLRKNCSALVLKMVMQLTPVGTIGFPL
jgi:hypothetical protein